MKMILERTLTNEDEPENLQYRTIVEMHLRIEMMLLRSREDDAPELYTQHPTLHPTPYT